MKIVNIINVISPFFMVVGCLFVTYDALDYQNKVSARQDARIQQLKEISDKIEFFKDIPEAVEFYTKELKDIANQPDDTRWHFGDSIMKYFNKK